MNYLTEVFIKINLQKNKNLKWQDTPTSKVGEECQLRINFHLSKQVATLPKGGKMSVAKVIPRFCLFEALLLPIRAV